MILVGTDRGLFALDGSARLPESEVTWLAPGSKGFWAVVDGRVLRPDGTFADREGPEPTCVAPTSHGVLVGLPEAGLERLDDGPVRGFTDIPGREGWYTPWGGPPDTRSVAESTDGTLHVNVHVGGIPRSRDGGATWEPTIDIATDVHQVLAHPQDPNVVLAAAAVGLCVSRDGGDSYSHRDDGLHSSYARAVAVAGDRVLVTASTGPSGGQAALYRGPIALDRPFEKCTSGLPEWFHDNIDTGCLTADGDTVAFGTGEGDVYVSEDAGATWERAVTGLPRVLAVCSVGR